MQSLTVYVLITLGTGMNRIAKYILDRLSEKQ